MPVEYVGFSESALPAAFGNVTWVHALSANQDRVLAICLDRWVHTDPATKFTTCTVDDGGGAQSATEQVDQRATIGGGDPPWQWNSIWTFDVPDDWAGNVTILATGGSYIGHGWCVEVKGASGEVGATAGDDDEAVTVPDTLVSSLIVDRYDLDGLAAVVSAQTAIDTMINNSVDNRYDSGHAISYAGGGGNIVMSYTTIDAPMAICAIELLAAPPAYTTRPVEYFLDAWDLDQNIKDARGRIIPRWKIKPNKWCYVAGLGDVTADVYPTFYDNDNLVYFESVKYDGETDKVQIITNKGSLPEIMMARLQLGRAG